MNIIPWGHIEDVFNKLEIFIVTKKPFPEFCFKYSEHQTVEYKVI